MKPQAVWVGLGLAVMTLGTGCASFHARTSKDYQYEPHTYPALRYTWDWEDGLYDRYEPAYMSRPGPFQPSGGRSLGGSIVVFFGYTVGFLVYASVVETPVSLVTDTVLYPYDRLRLRDYARSAATFKQALLGDAWPASPRTLRRHYWPRTCDSVVGELLRSPDTPDFREKIWRLLDAGMAVRVIAGSAPLDNETVCAVFDAADGDPDVERLLLERLFEHSRLTEDTAILRRLVEAGDFTVQIAGGAYLDDELAAAVIGQALTPPVNRPALHRLSQNPSTPPTVMQQLLALDTPDMPLKESVLRNPATPVAILREHSGDTRLWPSLLSNTNTPVEVLETVLANEKNGHRMALIVNHPNATAEQLSLTASLAFRAQMLQRIVEHPNASAETLEMVIQRCDELIALIPTAGDNWRVRNAGLSEPVLREIRQSALRRTAAD